MSVDRDWSKTNHPFIPLLRTRVATLQGMDRVQALMGLADAFWEEEDYVAALETIGEARDISEDLGQRAMVARCDQSAAVFLRDDALYGAALDRADSARKLWIDLGNLHEVAECDAIMSGCLLRIGKPEEAITKLDNARAIFMEMGAEEDAVVCVSLKGEISVKPRETDGE